MQDTTKISRKWADILQRSFFLQNSRSQIEAEREKSVYANVNLLLNLGKIVGEFVIHSDRCRSRKRTSNAVRDKLREDRG